MLRTALLAACICLPVVSFASENSAEFDKYVEELSYLSLKDPKPAIANIASGFGAGAGVFYAAVSYSNFDTQTNVEEDDDGSIAFGVGLGNA